jgi:predicted metal-dependent hydrolase
VSAARKPKPEAITKAELKAEVAAWAKLMKVTPNQVHVRRMTHKWGSCSTNGRVTLADDLRIQPPDERKEVIVHELLHLKVPNHGKLFKTLLRAYLAWSAPPIDVP